MTEEERLKLLHATDELKDNLDLAKRSYEYKIYSALGLFKYRVGIETRVLENSKKSIWIDDVGLTWFTTTTDVGNQKEALDKASNLGLRLPTKEEFERVESEGIRNKFEKLNNNYYWSSSKDPIYNTRGYLYNSYDGVIYNHLDTLYAHIVFIKDKDPV